MSELVCGVGGWGGPKPGDPDNNSVLSAVGVFGGIEVSWTYPVINPSAVAHTILYRATTSNFSNAVQRAVVAGNTYYDKTDSAMTMNTVYWFWIQIVSINGTVGEVIGPVSATARPTISQTIEMLTGKIDDSALGQKLREDIGKVYTLEGSITEETKSRLSGVGAINENMTVIQQTSNNAITIIGTERTARITADSATMKAVDLLAVSFGNAVAGVRETVELKTGPTSALAKKVTEVESTLGKDYAYIKEELKTVVDDKVAYAGRITQVETKINGNTATGEIGLTAEISKLDGRIKNMFTVKLSSNGLIGGFGLSNDGTIVDANFDVDRFSVGRTLNGRKPFIIDSATGEVLINNAVIGKITFDKLVAADGQSSILEGGKISGKYISAKGLEITDDQGRPIFTSGTAFDITKLPGFDSLATQSTIDMSISNALATIPTTAESVIGETVMYIDPVSKTKKPLQVTDFVSGLSKISSNTISSFIDTAAIGNAYIGNAAIKNANIENLAIDTIKIRNNAVSSVGGSQASSCTFTGKGGSVFVVAKVVLVTDGSCTVELTANGMSLDTSSLGGGGNTIQVAVSVSGQFNSVNGTAYELKVVVAGVQSFNGNYSINYIEVLK